MKKTASDSGFTRVFSLLFLIALFWTRFEPDFLENFAFVQQFLNVIAAFLKNSICYCQELQGFWHNWNPGQTSFFSSFKNNLFKSSYLPFLTVHSWKYTKYFGGRFLKMKTSKKPIFCLRLQKDFSVTFVKKSLILYKYRSGPSEQHFTPYQVPVFWKR